MKSIFHVINREYNGSSRAKPFRFLITDNTCRVVLVFSGWKSFSKECDTDNFKEVGFTTSIFRINDRDLAHAFIKIIGIAIFIVKNPVPLERMDMK